MTEKVLLHACCGICSAYPILNLKEAGYEPVVYFYNPNIYPKSEYQKRFEAQKILCDFHKVELLEGRFEPEKFIELGLEDEPEKGLRCDKCFELRLSNAAQKAKEIEISTFSTSIVISPHKDFKKLKDMGMKIAKDYGIKYLAIDFKKKDGFLKSNKISKEIGLYRQNYCGCKYSIR